MAKSKFIYSTLSCDQIYQTYKKGSKNDVAQVEHAVRINGGANVANKHIITPKGVVTKIDEADYALLKDVALFQTHVKNGFITVEDKEYQVEKVVADQTGRDESAPLTPDDFSNDKAPKLNDGKGK